jgi:hypothetical protein
MRPMTISKAFLIFSLSFGVLAALFIGNLRAIATAEHAANGIIDLLLAVVMAGLLNSALAAARHQQVPLVLHKRVDNPPRSSRGQNQPSLPPMLPAVGAVAPLPCTSPSRQAPLQAPPDSSAEMLR